MSVSSADTVIFTATWENSIPVSTEALAVAALPSQKSQNSLWVPVASPAEKNAATLATAPENEVLEAALRSVSVPSVVSPAAGVVVFDPSAT